MLELRCAPRQRLALLGAVHSPPRAAEVAFSRWTKLKVPLAPASLEAETRGAAVASSEKMQVLMPSSAVAEVRSFI